MIPADVAGAGGDVGCLLFQPQHQPLELLIETGAVRILAHHEERREMRGDDGIGELRSLDAIAQHGCLPIGAAPRGRNAAQPKGTEARAQRRRPLSTMRRSILLAAELWPWPIKRSQPGLAPELCRAVQG